LQVVNFVIVVFAPARWHVNLVTVLRGMKLLQFISIPAQKCGSRF